MVGIFQEGVLARNARLNALNTQLGVTPTLRIYSGGLPVNCAAPEPSGLLCAMSLPSPPFALAVAGAMSLTGTWSGTATATGVAASFRIFDTNLVCQQQGDISYLNIGNTLLTLGAPVTVMNYTITAGNE